MSGWGSKWPVALKAGWPKNDPENIIEDFSGITPKMLGVKDWPEPSAIALTIGEMTVLATFERDGLKYKKIDQAELKPELTNLKSQGSNLVDTEDYLYLQCENCKLLLNPHTKSFKTLQEKRVAARWKCVWNDNGVGYKVYCEECSNG